MVLRLRLCADLEENELAALLKDLDARGLLGFDAMSSAIEVIGTTTYPDRLERILRAAESPALQRLGLAALEHAARSAGGWTTQRRRALRRYRQSPAPTVAGPAQLVVVPS